VLRSPDCVTIAGGDVRWRIPPLAGGLLGARLGSEFLPKLEEGNLWIRALLPPTITLEAGMDSVAEMRRIIMSYAPVRTVVSEQGRGEDATDPDGSFVAEFFVPLKPFDEWPAGLNKEKLVEQMSAELHRKFVGVDFNFSQYIQDNIEEAVSGVKGENSVKIFGATSPSSSGCRKRSRPSLRKCRA
jgi:cobalt-zinc-cadmium resistance protein CzcA